jgi:hypothetical protein
MSVIVHLAPHHEWYPPNPRGFAPSQDLLPRPSLTPVDTPVQTKAYTDSCQFIADTTNHEREREREMLHTIRARLYL